MPYQTIPSDSTAPTWTATQTEALMALASYPAPEEGQPPARVFFFADDTDTVGVELDTATFLPRPRPA